MPTAKSLHKVIQKSYSTHSQCPPPTPFFRMVRVSRVRVRVRVSLRIRVRFTFGDRVGIGLPNVE